MYQKEKIIQHQLVYLLDIVAMIISLLLANMIRFQGVSLEQYGNLYVEVFTVMIIVYIVYIVLYDSNPNVILRGKAQEAMAVIKLNICVAAVSFAYLYLTKQGSDYSRIQLCLFFGFDIVMQYAARLFWKYFAIERYKKSKACHKIMLITTSDRAEQVVADIKKTNNWYFRIAYIAIVDKAMKGQYVDDIPVVADSQNIIEVSKKLELDEVFFHMPSDKEDIVKQYFGKFREMGVSVHINVNVYDTEIPRKSLEKLGNFLVVSYADRSFSFTQMFLKRTMDIIGAIVGLIITGIVFIFVAPAIYIESPGPVFFSQIRVGRNGRRFKIYKFRSMYMDAEERKKELMAQNEMKGLMFKMTDDPRVTKVGKFIRKTSIDELPQFWNILKGDMSLVGTRPPTVDEVEQYETRHRRRLSITPGLTGLWQVSGRSDIQDFDEVVKLDLEYIDNWSILLDIKLILKTVAVVFMNKGAK